MKKILVLLLFISSYCHAGSMQQFGTQGSNYFSYEADGTIVLTGAATVWDDLRVPAFQMKTTGTSPPDTINFGAGGALLAYAFDGGSTMEQIFFHVQIPHSAKSTGFLYPHVHWAPTTADAGDVRWHLAYSMANIDGVFNTVLTNTYNVDAAAGAAWTHQVSDLWPITRTSATVSAMINGRLYRDPTDPLDNYEHDAALLEFDLHYEIDTLGSRTEAAK